MLLGALFGLRQEPSLDSLASCFGRNQAALIGGLHTLPEDALGCGVDLNVRLTGNK
jgi:hypothetical protein